MDYQILGKIPVDNQELSDIMIKEIESDAIRTAEDFNRRAQALRAKARRHSGSNDVAKNRGTVVADAGLSGGSHRDTAEKGRSLQKGNGADTVEGMYIRVNDMLDYE